jgi:hypothetical protein
MSTLVGAKTNLSARGTPGPATWRDTTSTPRPYLGPITQRRPGGIPGRQYGSFSREAVTTVTLDVSDTASLSATEEPFDRNEIATTDTARLSASDVSLLFNRIDVTDTASLTAGETISVVISGVTLKTASDTASLSATEAAAAVGVSLAVTDTASLQASDTSALVVSAENISVTDTASLSADDVQLLEIFAGIVEKSVSDTATFTVTDSAVVVEVGRIRKIKFEARVPRITFEVL